MWVWMLLVTFTDSPRGISILSLATYPHRQITAKTQSSETPSSCWSCYMTIWMPSRTRMRVPGLGSRRPSSMSRMRLEMARTSCADGARFKRCRDKIAIGESILRSRSVSYRRDITTSLTEDGSAVVSQRVRLHRHKASRRWQNAGIWVCRPLTFRSLTILSMLRMLLQKIHACLRRLTFGAAAAPCSLGLVWG